MQYDDIRHGLLQRLATATPPTAIVASPYTAEIVSAVLRAQRERLVSKVLLVGDPARIPLGDAALGPDLQIRAVDGEANVLDFVHERLRQGDRTLVVKGNISSGKLLRTVLSAGTRQDDRLSHIYVIDSKAFPDRAIVFSDAGVNIRPDLQTKEKIVANAVLLAKRIGYERPRIALISATETVNPAIPSTVDAAALRDMANRGHFGDCHVDGPMAIDAAMIPRSAAAKSLRGEVAGRADILISSDIDGANSTAKALIGSTGRAMGVIYGGGGVPIAFPSRGDSEETRLDSILLAAALACEEPGVMRRTA